MATFDAHKNFAISTVAVAPSSPTGGTSLSVFAGDGTKFPAVPFNAVIWPVNTQPVTANAEIVRVTNISGDVFTITRNAEVGGTTRSVVVGDQIGANLTAKLLTDIETLFPVGAVVGTTDTQVLTNKTLTAPAISAPVLSGTATGTYTLAGTPTITAPAISAPVLSGTATGTYTLGGTPTITAPVINGNVTGSYVMTQGTSTYIITTATGVLNNWAPGLNGNTFIQINGSADILPSGLTGGVVGQIVTFYNATGFICYLASNSSAAGLLSLSVNRFYNAISSGPTPLALGGYATYQYNSNGWLLINHSQGSSIAAPFVAGIGGSWSSSTGSFSVPGETTGYIVQNKTLLVRTSATGTVVGSPNILSRVVPGGYTTASGTFNTAMRAGNAGVVSNGMMQPSGTTLIFWTQANGAGWTAGTCSVEGGLWAVELV